MLRRRRGFVAAVAATLAAVAAVAMTLLVTAEPACQGMFNDDAVLDTAQVIDLRPEARPDWDQAMAACRAAGFNQAECVDSVSEGEF